MKTQYQSSGDALVVSLQGRLDSSSWESLWNELLLRLQSAPARLVFDLSELEYVSSAGMRVFLLAQGRVREQGGKIELLDPNEFVRRTLEISQIQNICPIVVSRKGGREKKREPLAETRLYGFSAGDAMRDRLATRRILPLIGIYDVFSAQLAARRFEGVFCSGFGYAASQYGLPDIGYVNWHDIMDFATRVRQVLPATHLLVDVDDGFGEEPIAANTIKNLEMNGISAVMMEDQKRPRRCGHFEGKQVLPAEQYLVKLKAVLAARKSLFVIARTDATDMEDGMRRAVRYAEAGADAVMVEAVHCLKYVKEVVQAVKKPVMVNQLHGGKSPNWTLDEMQDAGVAIVIFSTPCLFAAQYAIEKYLDEMQRHRKLVDENTVVMSDCVNMLYQPPMGK
jgi:anti-anti-sigma factor